MNAPHKLHTLIFAALLLASGSLFGQAEEEKAYCVYQSQQAMAQATLLRTPTAVAGVADPNTGTSAQMYWGVSSSLANYNRAKLTVDVARKSCDSYRATTEATLEIQSALQSLERAALFHRRELLQAALDQLDEMVQQNTKLVEVKNATRPMLYSVQALRAKLVADRTNTDLKLAAIYVPETSNAKPLQQLVEEKENLDLAAQKSMASLNRPSNWDVQWEAGARQRLSSAPALSSGSSVKPYGAITFSYNFGGRSSDRHLEQAATAYGDWKKVQEGDVARNAHVLQQQIRQSIVVEQAALHDYREQEKEIDGNLQQLAGVETTAARAFSNQLDSDKLLLQVEIKDATFRLQQLEEYLKNNF